MRPSVALRVETLPDLTVQLGTGSTFEAAGAADKLRDEIGELFRDGTLAVTMAKYSYYGLDDTWATYSLIDAAERVRWMAWGFIVLCIGVGVTVWQAASLRQRKRSAAALQVSEERFRAIFDQAAVGVAQLNLEGEVTLVNRWSCDVLGYVPEELVGTAWAAKMHPDDRGAVLTDTRRLLEGEIASFSTEGAVRPQRRRNCLGKIAQIAGARRGRTAGKSGCRDGGHYRSAGKPERGTLHRKS